MSSPIQPGATIGVLGGGQLGRMFIEEAQAHGFRCIVRTDEAPGGPGAQVADGEFVGPFDSDEINDAFARCCAVITAEFENLPGALLADVARRAPLRPGAMSVTTCQHRRREKEFLASNTIPHAPFVVVRSAEEVCSALTSVGGRGILKSAAFGYDGRGQIRLATFASESACREQCRAAWAELAVDEAVLEGFVDFVREISVVGARGADGSWVAFPPGENVHVDGILDYTVAPACVSDAVVAQAVAIAEFIASALDYVGTIGVEFFVLPDDSLVVNEMAPRPHNSGHHTIDACSISQFGLQLQAVTGQSLTVPSQHSSAVMVNLLGDLWGVGGPDWLAVDGQPGCSLHLYGKASARPGRKMGHLTVLAQPGESRAALIDRALALRRSVVP